MTTADLGEIADLLAARLKRRVMKPVVVVMDA